MNRPLAKVLLYTGVTALAGAALSGCLGEDHRRDVGYGMTEQVRTLVIEGETGDVEVTGGGAGIEVTEHQTYRETAPETTHTVADGTLTLSYRCPDGDCGVGYRVRVPAGTVVKVHNSTGDIRLTGLSGEVEARTGTGGINAALSSPVVRLAADTGNVTAAVDGDARRVEAVSGTGDVRVRVPRGRPYAVDTASDTGTVKVSVDRAAGTDRSITARTETGDVTVDGV
ncbi:DUF4097 family beta strand repeat-containing protein [Kitasatospora sp. NPDC085879]|uniref:DUF4097 family beta strand repeat-containing protein n=1 Tax=Kitasatospora sp. NPDC085879 TaxID=3154769 RepID=UPI000BB12BE3|nr:DUF4097 family beta strand repeat-containing protein [Streptomyces sp. TLI_235]PBC79281.1 hypothetical protein BX265_4082 [Streptomyces sp. TLI_235]